MPIRFACTRCRQALQISSRKAGTAIQCPKCQTTLTVPAPSAEANRPANPAAKTTVKPATPATRTTTPTPTKPSAVRQEAKPTIRTGPKPDEPAVSSLHIEISPDDVRPAKLEPDFASLIVFDDVPAALDAPTPASTAGASGAAAGLPRAPAAGAVPFDPRLVAVSRNVLYAQAILIAAVGLLSFAIGYFAGRGVRQPSPEEILANQQPVEVEGDVAYGTERGVSHDVGAVVIAVPHGRAPGQKFAINGLKPGDPLEADGGVNLAIQAVESEGGAYVRADENGEFLMRVRPGKYWIVAISAASARPAGMLPTIHDVKTLGRYFENAADLLADRRYQLSEKQLPDDAPLEITLTARH